MLETSMVASTEEFCEFSSSKFRVPATSPKMPVVSDSKYLTENSALECSRSTDQIPCQPCVTSCSSDNVNVLSPCHSVEPIRDGSLAILLKVLGGKRPVNE